MQVVVRKVLQVPEEERVQDRRAYLRNIHPEMGAIGRQNQQTDRQTDQLVGCNLLQHDTPELLGAGVGPGALEEPEPEEDRSTAHRETPAPDDARAFRVPLCVSCAR